MEPYYRWYIELTYCTEFQTIDGFPQFLNISIVWKGCKVEVIYMLGKVVNITKKSVTKFEKLPIQHYK